MPRFEQRSSKGCIGGKIFWHHFQHGIRFLDHIVRAVGFGIENDQEDMSLKVAGGFQDYMLKRGQGPVEVSGLEKCSSQIKFSMRETGIELHGLPQFQNSVIE